VIEVIKVVRKIVVVVVVVAVAVVVVVVVLQQLIKILQYCALLSNRQQATGNASIM